MKYVETRLRFIQTHPAFSDRFESKNYVFLDCGKFEFIYIFLKKANHTSKAQFWFSDINPIARAFVSKFGQEPIPLQEAFRALDEIAQSGNPKVFCRKLDA